MVSTKINAEITEYHEKFFLGLSIRQLICFGLGIALALATGITGYTLGASMDLLGYGIMIEVIPFLALGFFHRNGYPAEKYAAIWWHWHFGPAHLPAAINKEYNHVSKKASKNRIHPCECCNAVGFDRKTVKSRKADARQAIKAAEKATEKEKRERGKANSKNPSAQAGSRLPAIRPDVRERNLRN